ncbi:MAG: nucleoside-diphosphate sugar epimerase/dehydratase [Phycisphaerae bacterium]|nr:nucleoside-diphosphate sugar epimerase/dehydratase [Phycisphaerae bacterium]
MAAMRFPFLYSLVTRNRRATIFAVHSLLFLLALFGSFLLRFDFRLTAPDKLSWIVLHFLPAAPILLAIKLGVFGFFRLYDGWWRYAGFKDLLGVVKATYVSTLLFFMIVYLQYSLFQGLNQAPLISPGFPRSIYLMDFGLTIGLVGGMRLLARLWNEEMRPISREGVTRLLIVGAGNAGAGLLHEIYRMPAERYVVVGFVDDDPAKQNVRIMSIPVLGTTEELPGICKAERVEEIIIAIPTATRKQIQRVVNLCQGTALRFRAVPSISDLINGKVSVNQIKEVDINDLLGRDPVALDTEGIAAFLKGRSVLITGAGGSIGSEMCRQVAAFAPSRLILLEQAENVLFFVERELRDKFPGMPVVAYICDIADRARTDRIFQDEKPAVVFHAAAHKHVPLMEANPGEAIKNNVFGTKSVADASARAGVEKFVMISTDKAVNPTSVMGCSKRCAEIYIQNLGRHSSTQFVTVRFGNVLGSAGSVVPIFRAQIAAGGPVTVTDDKMVRYFMTIPEASQLVLQAGSMGRGGEIFVLDMGDPVKIIDLARTMITLSGFRPDEDIEIRVTGRRPGEKLFEELSILGEDMAQTPHPKILAWKNVPYDDQRIQEALQLLAGVTDARSPLDVVRALRQIVPEYTPESLAAKPAIQPRIEVA